MEIIADHKRLFAILDGMIIATMQNIDDHGVATIMLDEKEYSVEEVEEALDIIETVFKEACKS